jgi:hypothetical protein
MGIDPRGERLTLSPSKDRPTANSGHGTQKETPALGRGFIIRIVVPSLDDGTSIHLRWLTG